MQVESGDGAVPCVLFGERA